MQKPRIPEEEQQRIEALHSLQILDSELEERFDRITRLAKRIFDVPIAAVSLVDTDRQWFKSIQGLDCRETSRDVSFCGHTILDDSILMVEDARKDIRFADNPLVTNDPHIVFYAGCPIYHKNGQRLGTFCIIDTEVKTLTKSQLENLKDLALLVQHELESMQLATLDELTQISNRRGFELLASAAIKLGYRHKVTCSLIYFDLNKFKPINDQHGHIEGDWVLKQFAALLRECFRDSDIFARIGGDEFVVLLGETDKIGAEITLKRLNQMLCEFQIENPKPYDIEFSAGVVEFVPCKDTKITKLLDWADQEMYKNKSHYHRCSSDNNTPVE